MRAGGVAVVAGCLIYAVAAHAATAAAAARRAAAPTYELLRARASRDSARSAWVDARWSGTFAQLRIAADRLDAASERYRLALHSAPLPASLTAKTAAPWVPVALDLAEAGEWARAHQLLHGPLLSERSLLPLQAAAAGRVVAPQAGLGVLGWPPDRRDGPGQRTSAFRSRRERDRGEAELFVAATLSDSLGMMQAARAARWRLFEDQRPMDARIWARYALARDLAEGGEPRLAIAVLTRGPSRSTPEDLLLADLTAGIGDSTSAARILIAAGGRSDLATADRYTLVRKAAGWMLGPLADSVSESEWSSLLRTLGDVGEGALALRVMDARRAAAPNAGATSERERLRASLLYRARRFEAAASAYSTLLQRAGATKTDRAEVALGLARAERSTRDFSSSDTAFAVAASLDSAGTTGETAAWERAREWEDRKSPREAAAMFRWARSRARTPAMISVTRVHEALAWIRADSLRAADAALADAPPGDALVSFWRGWLAQAARDTTSALRHYRNAWEADPWSYEGVRSRELAGLAIDPTQGNPQARARHETRRTSAPPPEIRVLELVGFREMARERLRACATGEAEAQANGCIDALEERGRFRTGRGSIDLDLRLRFPPAYAGAVFRAADQEGLSPTFIWSIMRKESGYLPAARSRAGALGLLQLMPPTASRLAGRSVPEDSLLVPDLNVRLGARYLRQLVREFGDLRAVAAAYNGGEEAVRRWVGARPKVDDLWVELIPFRETRDYVKQVYAAMRRYEAVYEAAPSPH